MLDNLDIICISPTYWDEPWGTHQQIMWRLAETNRVLYLELPISPLSPFTALRYGTCLRQLKYWRNGLRIEKKTNLIIASPPPVFPFRYHKITNKLNQNILAHYIAIKTRKLEFAKPLLVTFQADSGVLVNNIEANPKIYYCTDDWSATDRWWQPPKYVISRERELIKTCDIVLGTSQRLVARHRPMDKPTYFMPNAVDYDLFSLAQKLEAPKELRDISSPKIGFVGIMNEHSFDSELVEWLARRHHRWTFVIVGARIGRKPDLSKLMRLRNVLFMGYKPKNMLPSLLAGIDVCIIPWNLTRWTKSAFSLKLFEYLAAGKPVVSVWTEEYLPYNRFIYLARTREEFEQSIIDGLNESNSNLVDKRMSIAMNNTWDDRVSEFSKIVNNFLNSKRSV